MVIEMACLALYECQGVEDKRFINADAPYSDVREPMRPTGVSILSGESAANYWTRRGERLGWLWDDTEPSIKLSQPNLGRRKSQE
ncbi:hypothetical protein RB195_005408 [Necator americanus]|uniref:Uncharacterized protein n=1 Tax=Necator americanus TaxID=51031 RepID=A0ABR1BPB7_NECAM